MTDDRLRQGQREFAVDWAARNGLDPDAFATWVMAGIEAGTISEGDSFETLGHAFDWVTR